MSTLTRDQFFAAAPQPKVRTVAVPALGGVVGVRQLSIGQRDEFEIQAAKTGGKDFRARLVVLSAVDEGGSPLFTDADVPALSALAGHALEPIVEAATKMNKLSPDEIERLAKN